MEQEENKEESPDHNPGISMDEADTSRNETNDNVPLYEEEEEDPEERRKRRKEKKRKKREKRRLQEQQREEEEKTDVQPQTDPYEDVIERRKEEEDRIKRSWVQQMSVQNRVSPEPQENPPTNPPENTLYRQSLQTSAPQPVLAERGMEAHEMSSTGGEQRPGGHRVPTKHYKEVIIGAGGEDDEGDIGCCGWILTGLSILIVVLSIPFSIFFCLKVVQEYERAVIFRLGRLLSGGAKGPGIFFVLPCIENYTKVDLRTVSFDVPPQEILTRDSVTVSVDAVVYYRISNPTVSVANVENAHHATRLLAQTTLRNILGTKNMSEILGDREAISNAMQNMLDDATDRWGIKVERVEIKDVRLPIQLQRAMAAEAEASREARAKLLAAEGEHKASRALKEAADIINQSPAALQLRYLQTLNSISSEKNSTIIFPLPIDLVSMFMRK